MFEKFVYFMSGLFTGAVCVYVYEEYKNETDEERALDEKQRKEAREFVKDVMSA